ncbi:MAG: hypothetical protein IJR14_01975 [Synergistaceae bacterium]|nr:hypothetical protein [Synergistaceae bacterium]
MMYHAHYDATTGEILGFYHTDIHDTIPSPSIELTEEQWQQALLGGWLIKNGGLVEAPPREPTKAELVAALTREYEPQFAALRDARQASLMAGYGDEAVAEIDAEYRALIAEFNAKMEAIA